MFGNDSQISAGAPANASHIGGQDAYARNCILTGTITDALCPQKTSQLHPGDIQACSTVARNVTLGQEAPSGEILAGCPTGLFLPVTLQRATQTPEIRRNPTMPDLNFSCVSCGKCCHDLRLPLTWQEAIDWLSRKGTVELLCEALPWLEEPDPSNLQAQHKRRRSFPTMSGDLPIRVIVVLTAVYSGACPNLNADFRCNIYEIRPHVCRIYPAEINPFIALSPANKLCPPEAWVSPAPLIRGDTVVDDEARTHIALSRRDDEAEALSKQALCALLGIGSAGLGSEGFAVHAPPAEDLLKALREALQVVDQENLPSWTFLSNQASTINALTSAGANAQFTSSTSAGLSRYIGFRADASDA
jgi:Fe-S-cluster containining protein